MAVTRNEATRYMNLVSLDDARILLNERFSFSFRTVMIPVTEACGRVTAEAVFSPLSVPATHLSAMDGIAVSSRETIGATDQSPVTLTRTVRVNTGNVVPDGCDAVIMIEDVLEKDDAFLIRAAAHPWQHIRPAGEDIAASEMILPKRTIIRPEDIGAMASYGISSVPVLDLRVALIPTGSEIVPVGTMPGPGQVIESNMHMAQALLRSTGVSVTRYPIVPDDPDQIRSTVEEAALHHDIILISAGSSKGTRDYTAGVISGLGEVFIHGVGIKPAKPVIIGGIGGHLVIGMPGYPLACHTILRELLLPLLDQRGFPVPVQPEIPVHVTSTLHSEIGMDEFVLTTVGKIGDRWVAVPLSRGSGVQMSMVRSNAYLKIPASSEGIEAGEMTRAVLTVPEKRAGEVVLITGSHDPVIDHLADLVRGDGIRIASTHVGSMGGLRTIRQRDCHLAPMHLLSADGDYNREYLKKYLPDTEMILICVAEREQGVVSRDGLAFPDITSHSFINRQRGSGTRMLLDHLLAENGISPEAIEGYDREVTTHLGVCLSVLNGEADMGVAVYSAAHAYELSFTPIGTERYELVTTREIFETDPRVRSIAETLGSEGFKEILNKLGGYRTAESGVIRRCNQQHSD